MSPELERFLQAQGVRFDEEGRPVYYDAFEGTTRRLNQDELARYTQNFDYVNSAKDGQGRPMFGSDVYTGLNNRFGNTPDYDPVTIDGVNYLRGKGTYEENYAADPRMAKVYDQYGVTPNDFRYDPTYGALLRGDVGQRIAKPLAEQFSPDGFLDNPINLMGMMAGMAGGASMLTGAGYGSAAGASALESLPSSYWNMMAEGGGTLSDAVSAGAGTFEGGSSLTNFGEFLNPQYTQSVPGMSGAFNGDLASLRSLIDPSINFVQNIPGISTAAGAAAFPGIAQGALGAAGTASSLGSTWDKLFTPKNLLTAGTSLLGSGLNAYAANKAAGAQVDSTDKATAAALAMYDQNRADLAPWRMAGAEALGSLSAMTKPGYQFNSTDPSYQFRMDQGQKTLERSRAAAGNLFSGGTGKALTRYGQDYASTEYGNQYNRLANLAGLGQAATNTTINAGQNTAQQVGQNTIGAGNARASGYVGSANAFSGGLSNILRGMQEQELLDALFRR